MPYNFVADGFHTNKHCSRLSSSEVRFYTENGRFTIFSPLWGLNKTYTVYLRPIGKRVVDFILALIELMLGEALRAKID